MSGRLTNAMRSQANKPAAATRSKSTRTGVMRRNWCAMAAAIASR